MEAANPQERRKPRVLVVDDDAYIRKLVTLSLAKQYDVVEAADGLDAVGAFLARDPDLILLDICMPDMDGWQACQQIRDASDVPIVMLTTLTQSADIVK